MITMQLRIPHILIVLLVSFFVLREVVGLGVGYWWLTLGDFLSAVRFGLMFGCGEEGISNSVAEEGRGRGVVMSVVFEDRLIVERGGLLQEEESYLFLEVVPGASLVSCFCETGLAVGQAPEFTPESSERDSAKYGCLNMMKYVGIDHSLQRGQSS
jgi:hypothetical protein